MKFAFYFCYRTWKKLSVRWLIEQKVESPNKRKRYFCPRVNQALFARQLSWSYSHKYGAKTHWNNRTQAMKINRPWKERTIFFATIRRDLSAMQKVMEWKRAKIFTPFSRAYHTLLPPWKTDRSQKTRNERNLYDNYNTLYYWGVRVRIAKEMKLYVLVYMYFVSLRLWWWHDNEDAMMCWGIKC